MYQVRLNFGSRTPSTTTSYRPTLPSRPLRGTDPEREVALPSPRALPNDLRRPESRTAEPERGNCRVPWLHTGQRCLDPELRPITALRLPRTSPSANRELPASTRHVSSHALSSLSGSQAASWSHHACETYIPDLALLPVPTTLSQRIPRRSAHVPWQSRPPEPQRGARSSRRARRRRCVRVRAAPVELQHPAGALHSGSDTTNYTPGVTNVLQLLHIDTTVTYPPCGRPPASG